MTPADDLSIKGNIGLFRGLKPTELSFDVAGNPVFSDGVFRTTGGLSAFRDDKASTADLFADYQQATRVAYLTVQDIRDAGCIIQDKEPPKGHVEIYRKDDPNKRISGSSAGKMAKRAKLLPDLRP